MDKKTSYIWSHYSNQLRAYIRSRVAEGDVEDLLQEVFFRIHKNISTLKSDVALNSWIYTITKNLINDYYRDSKITIGLDEYHLLEEDKDTFYDQMTECLKPMITQLPPKYKRAIFLSDIKGIKQAEIARMLNVSESGAKSRVQRGRKILASKFAELCGYNIDEKGHLLEKELCPKCYPLGLQVK